jgi:hypothetical protein
MRRWPPLVWPLVSLASLLILMAFRKPEALALGVTLLMVALGIGLWLALAGHRDRPRPRGYGWWLVGVAAWYLVAAIAGATLSWWYAVAALLAGAIPLTATAVWLATARSKTVGTDERPADVSPEAHDDPFPGIGMDSETPLGDTPEHSDAERVAEPDRRFRRNRDRDRAERG